jgi:hypothetical protein
MFRALFVFNALGFSDCCNSFAAIFYLPPFLTRDSDIPSIGHIPTLDVVSGAFRSGLIYCNWSVLGSQ